jgi:hypothetical protein
MPFYWHPRFPAGSYVFLGEAIGNVVEAVGYLIVVGAMTWYLHIQWQETSTAEAGSFHAVH